LLAALARIQVIFREWKWEMVSNKLIKFKKGKNINVKYR